MYNTVTYKLFVSPPECSIRQKQTVYFKFFTDTSKSFCLSSSLKLESKAANFKFSFRENISLINMLSRNFKKPQI